MSRLPGFSIRGIADLHPGTAKVDARDAFVIADTARLLPYSLPGVDVGGRVLLGYDDDVPDQVSTGTKRIRNLPQGVRPPRNAHSGAICPDPQRCSRCWPATAAPWDSRQPIAGASKRPGRERHTACTPRLPTGSGPDRRRGRYRRGQAPILPQEATAPGRTARSTGMEGA